MLIFKGRRKMKKLLPILRWVLVVVLLVVGLALIFNEQIKSYVVHNMSQSAISQPVSKKKTKGNFDFQSVKAVDIKGVANATQDNTGAIGKIAIPSIGLKLPIFYGLDNNNLMRGAGTMKSNQTMGGENNYAIAGHHMEDPNILFGPLSKVKVGKDIYLTDEKNVYVYKVTRKVVVDEHEVKWVDDVPGKKLVTLVTCASGTEGEVNRVIVQGELTKVQKYTANKDSIFK